MLVFKDTILGFVASIQLSGTDMVRIGDWIEMPSHGADGDVIDISIHCVRVQNWDKTIATIPTYALVSNAFKNWRGMSESGGRRIKRAINIDMNSIRFVTDKELESMSSISLITDYVQGKQKEIEEYNQEHNVDTSVLINGRRQTNIGIFRAYIISYLRHHPKINQNMTFLVRQLKPTEHGLPIEIYVFSSDKVWANYEAIQADIFDHLLAALPVFDLRIFQVPSGYDFRNLGQKTAPPEAS
jgi:miniconductance mechanosensitive channel